MQIEFSFATFGGLKIEILFFSHYLRYVEEDFKMSMLSNEVSRESFDLPESGPSNEQMHQLMIEKAHELFKVCDVEEKGFITKRDMQRLQSELPLTPDQLEHVFDSLDDDKNEYLTLKEFTDGFGK